jgi:hypothetical protein
MFDSVITVNRFLCFLAFLIADISLIVCIYRLFIRFIRVRRVKFYRMREKEKLKMMSRLWLTFEAVQNADLSIKELQELVASIMFEIQRKSQEEEKKNG